LNVGLEADYCFVGSLGHGAQDTALRLFFQPS
jgi:hypothetical protein